MRVVLVLLTVVLSIASSVVLDYLSENDNQAMQYLFWGVGIALFINAMKFGLWGVIHRKYEVTSTYHIVSLFFPLTYAIAYFQGETELAFGKLIGLGLIVLGVVLLEKKTSLS